MNPVSLPAAWASVPRSATVAATTRCDDASAPAGAPSWALQRRCSLSPAQLGGCLALLAAMCTTVGLGFVWAGAAPVGLFAGLELMVVLLAFGVHALHAADGERLWLRADGLHAERRRGRRLEQRVFELDGLRLHAHGDGVIELRDRSGAWRVGECAEPARRQEVLAALRRACADARASTAD